MCELLRANLYEFQKYNLESGAPPWFTLARVQAIASQILRALAFLHQLDLIHAGGLLPPALAPAYESVRLVYHLHQIVHDRIHEGGLLPPALAIPYQSVRLLQHLDQTWN